MKSRFRAHGSGRAAGVLGGEVLEHVMVVQVPAVVASTHDPGQSLSRAQSGDDAFLDQFIEPGDLTVGLGLAGDGGHNDAGRGQGGERDDGPRRLDGRTEGGP